MTTIIAVKTKKVPKKVQLVSIFASKGFQAGPGNNPRQDTFSLETEKMAAPFGNYFGQQL
ncbi:hypothetical protein L0663_14915 [Dyadobacter sp. CY107]|uniref:hypothetical protein n=1 Tax=Dyadobacter fanqingshengii TaxID=2906443 RepID=UPI001F1D4B20|nr:hypothetical protein [Dyadobacter fanqingshengii]MCF2504682.1 hypothetical protein [Dyadobacter fanqingshengii]